MDYNVGDVVHIDISAYKGTGDTHSCVGIIVEKTYESQRTLDPDRRARISKYGVMSPEFSRIVFLTDTHLSPLSCKGVL